MGGDELAYNPIEYSMCYACEEMKHTVERRQISQMRPVINELVDVDRRICIVRHGIGGILKAWVSALFSSG